MSLFVVRDFAARMAQGHDVTCRDDALALATGHAMGTWVSMPMASTASFQQAVCSWNAQVPCGMVEVALQVADAAGSWGAWHVMGCWHGAGYAGRPRGTSVPGAGDDWGRVATDTLKLSRPAAALRLQVTLAGAENTPAPVVGLLACSTDARPPQGCVPQPQAIPTLLDVPTYSQRSHGEAGKGWCSPTSLAMVLAWHGTTLPVSEVAQAVYDPCYSGTGNWSCNVAYAGDLGYTAYVAHLHTTGQLIWLLGQGLPVIVSISHGPGELPGAPVEQTRGHLLVVCGLDPSTGIVVVNDPAGEPGAVRRHYPIDAFLRAWLGHGGVAYVVAPPANQELMLATCWGDT